MAAPSEKPGGRAEASDRGLGDALALGRGGRRDPSLFLTRRSSGWHSLAKHNSLKLLFYMIIFTFQ